MYVHVKVWLTLVKGGSIGQPYFSHYIIYKETDSMIVNRPVVAGAALQIPLLLINYFGG